MDTRLNILRLAVLASVAGAGCNGGPGIDGGPDASPSASGQMTGVPNYAVVSKVLCRGAQPTSLGYAELARAGVKTIVSLRVLLTRRKQLAGHGFRYHHISVKHVHPEEEDVVAFLAIVTNPDNQPVFVHCREGVDRTGMMVAAYRMVVQGWPMEKALAEMKRMGFHEINEPIEDYIEDLDVAAIKRRLARTPPPRIDVIP